MIVAPCRQIVRAGGAGGARPGHLLLPLLQQAELHGGHPVRPVIRLPGRGSSPTTATATATATAADTTAVCGGQASAVQLRGEFRAVQQP